MYWINNPLAWSEKPILSSTVSTFDLKSFPRLVFYRKCKMYSNDVDRPLFGVERPQERYINYAIGLITSIVVLETLISAFLFPLPPKSLHIFLAVVIVLVCISELLLIYWYRQGDLEPKFRQLIFYNSLTILLLCICANLIFHDNL